MGSWSLAAHGIAADEAADAELQARLAEILAGPKYGTSGSQLTTPAHNGPVHLAAKKASGKK